MPFSTSTAVTFHATVTATRRCPDVLFKFQPFKVVVGRKVCWLISFEGFLFTTCFFFSLKKLVCIYTILKKMYIYIYKHIYTHIYIYIHTHIYIYTPRAQMVPQIFVALTTIKWFESTPPNKIDHWVQTVLHSGYILF